MKTYVFLINLQRYTHGTISHFSLHNKHQQKQRKPYKKSEIQLQNAYPKHKVGVPRVARVRSGAGITASRQHSAYSQGKQRLRKRNPTHARHPIDFQTFEYAHLFYKINEIGPIRIALQHRIQTPCIEWVSCALEAVQVMLSIKHNTRTDSSDKQSQVKFGAGLCKVLWTRVWSVYCS